MAIPTGAVGRLIGVGGRAIRLLEAFAGCKVNVCPSSFAGEAYVQIISKCGRLHSTSAKFERELCARIVEGVVAKRGSVQDLIGDYLLGFFLCSIWSWRSDPPPHPTPLHSKFHGPGPILLRGRFEQGLHTSSVVAVLVLPCNFHPCPITAPVNRWPYSSGPCCAPNPKATSGVEIKNVLQGRRLLGKAVWFSAIWMTTLTWPLRLPLQKWPSLQQASSPQAIAARL